MVKPIVKKGVEFLTDTLGNKIGALPDTSYRMQHTPNPEGARLDDMTGGGQIFPITHTIERVLKLYKMSEETLRQKL